jgi:predicted lipoprotein with Yx(FWY)xxD motif
MKKILLTICLTIVIVASIIFLGCSPAYTVKYTYKQGTGYYLTDGKGIALYYYYNKDIQGNTVTGPRSVCTGTCATSWPPFYTDTLVLTRTISPDNFTVFTRDDGKKQLAYQGWPLYYSSQDKQPGDTNGEGAESGAWRLIRQ